MARRWAPRAGTAEIYNPATNAWTDTGPLNVPRFEDMAIALLPGGRVLLAGGFAPNTTGQPPFTPLASTEIWNPATNQWTQGNPMKVARGELASVTLQDGRILVMGGTDASGAGLKSAEIYDPRTGKWSYTGAMKNARSRCGGRGAGRRPGAGGRWPRRIGPAHHQFGDL